MVYYVINGKNIQIRNMQKGYDNSQQEEKTPNGMEFGEKMFMCFHFTVLNIVFSERKQSRRKKGQVN